MDHAPANRFRISAAFTLICCTAVSCTQTPQQVSTAAIAADAQGPVTVTYNPLTGRPSFLRARIAYPTTLPDTAVAYSMMRRYAAVFGTDSAARDLQYLDARIDSLGMRHMTVQQMQGGVEVYAARASVHLAREGGIVVAVSSNLVPGVRAAATQPTVSEDSARGIAGRQLPLGVAGASRLVL